MVVAAHYQVGLNALADLVRGVVVAVVARDGLLTRTDPLISKCYFIRQTQRPKMLIQMFLQFCRVYPNSNTPRNQTQEVVFKTIYWNILTVFLDR